MNEFDLKCIRTRNETSPKGYVLEDKGLVKAVQMAIWLGKPLLLTGAPGTGKTQLAYKIAYELSSGNNINQESTCKFLDKPFIFNTKTTSTATDLFYYYDAVRHFQRKYVQEFDDKGPKQGNGAASAHSFINVQALGKAILQAYGRDAILASKELQDLQQLADFDSLEKEPRSSVVLIDEIDKASRDFPNDLLFEIDNMEFYFNELMNKHVTRPQTGAQVVVIMTSNFEKNLPDAFLRRCLFYHIPFPGTKELMNIVCSRIIPHLEELYQHDPGKLQKISGSINNNLEKIVKAFEEVRMTVKEKQPATAELLEWVKALERQDFFEEPVDFKNPAPAQKEILLLSLPALTKNDTDLNVLREKYA